MVGWEEERERERGWLAWLMGFSRSQQKLSPYGAAATETQPVWWELMLGRFGRDGGEIECSISS